MKNYDPKTAARVWERVQTTAIPAADGQVILQLITDELLEASTFLRLSKRLPAYSALRQISQQDQAHAACLKGVYTMITGEKPKYIPAVATDDPPDIVLRRCYGRKMRALAQYESRLTDPQYGHIFRSLVRQEQEHCRMILEVMGTLSK